MCSTIPSLLSIGSPARRAAAVASDGAGHGGRASAPTATVAGGLVMPTESPSDVGRSGFLVTTMMTTTKTAATATATAAATHNHLLRQPLIEYLPQASPQPSSGSHHAFIIRFDGRATD